jgi:catechol 2,3-dioxygenase-like lactoylglutathione lyase family enzyme
LEHAKTDVEHVKQNIDPQQNADTQYDDHQKKELAHCKDLLLSILLLLNDVIVRVRRDGVNGLGETVSGYVIGGLEVDWKGRFRPKIRYHFQMTILRLHHAQITVEPDDSAAAHDFYCGTLGLRAIAKPPSLQHKGGFWVAIGDQEIHVSVETGVERLKTKVHLAYQVDDLTAWRDKLMANGIMIKESIPFDGVDRFECRDPFGNRLEFIQAWGEVGVR